MSNFGSLKLKIWYLFDAADAAAGVIMIILEVIRIGNTIRRTSNIDNKILK